MMSSPVAYEPIFRANWLIGSPTQIDMKSFEAYYQQYKGLVRGVIFNIAGASALDDLVQECFIKVWTGLSRFRRHSNIKTWIYRIAVNVALDHCRKNAKRSLETDLFDEADTRSSVEDSLNHQKIVQAGLEQLSPEHRTCLVLSVFEGLNIKEIAKVTEVAAGTVKSRLFYAREQMAHYLKDKGVRDEQIT